MQVTAVTRVGWRSGSALRWVAALGAVGGMVAAAWSRQRGERLEVLLGAVRPAWAEVVGRARGSMLFDLGVTLPIVLAAVLLGIVWLRRVRVEPCRVEPPRRWSTAWGRERTSQSAALAALGLAAANVPSLLARRQGWLPLLLWLASLGLCVIGAVLGDRRAGRSPGRFDAAGWLPVTAMTMLAFAWVAYDLGSWRWAGTPDEIPFLAFAQRVLLEHPLPYVFADAGTYRVHPVLSSVYSAGWLRAAGNDIVGFRLGSAVAFAAAVPGTFLLVRETAGRRAALAASGLLSFSCLPVAFAHLGYNQALGLPGLVWPLALGVWGVRRRSAAALALASVAAGVAAYGFAMARIALAMTPVLVAWVGRRDAWPRRTVVYSVVVPMLVSVLPLLAGIGEVVRSTMAFAGLAPGHVQAPHASWQEWVANAAHQAALGCLYPLGCGTSHFLFVPVVDGVSALFCFVGLALAVRALARGEEAGVLAACYLIVAGVAGGLSPYDYPPLTRLVCAAPFVAALAGLGVASAGHAVSDMVGRRWVGRMVTATLVAIGVGCSASDLFRWVYREQHGFGDGTTGELLRVLRTMPDDLPVLYIQGETFMTKTAETVRAYRPGQPVDVVQPFAPDKLPAMGSLTLPHLVVHGLPAGPDRERVERHFLAARSGGAWHDTDPGQGWSLRVLSLGPGSRSEEREGPLSPTGS